MKCGKRKEAYYSIPTQTWYGITLSSYEHSITQISIDNESN